MKTPDKRPRLMANALANTGLGNNERVFLVTVAMLATEYEDGKRRAGSQGMDARGYFALHYDYLARALHTSPGNAKKMTQRLEAKGYLSKVHAGTFGRPARFQALAVRGDEKSPVTWRSFVPPYASEDPPLRGDTTSPLPYRTPVGPDQAPTPGVSRPAQIAASSSREAWIEGRQVDVHLEACRMHGWDGCPQWCHELPGSREVS